MRTFAPRLQYHSPRSRPQARRLPAVVKAWLRRRGGTRDRRGGACRKPGSRRQATQACRRTGRPRTRACSGSDAAGRACPPGGRADHPAREPLLRSLASVRATVRSPGRLSPTSGRRSIVRTARKGGVSRAFSARNRGGLDLLGGCAIRGAGASGARPGYEEVCTCPDRPRARDTRRLTALHVRRPKQPNAS